MPRPTRESSRESPAVATMWTCFVGFMACGKTRTAEILARWTGQPAVDLDREIERRAGLSIPEIFGSQGVERFRELERETLAEVLAGPPAWLATGGGCVEDPENAALLRTAGLVVWLDAPWEILRRRIEEAGAERRPMVQHLGWDGMRALHRRRQRLYARAADFRLRTDQAGAAATARAVQLRCLLVGRSVSGGTS